MDNNANNTQASEQQNQQQAQQSQQQAQPEQGRQEPNGVEQQAEKLFTQADVDRIVGNRLARLKQDIGDTEQYRRERDDARNELEQYKNNAFLKEKGVKTDDLDYVLFKVSKLVDDKTDFRQAAETFLKENPRFTGRGYRIVSTGTSDGGTGGGYSASAEVREAMGLKG